MEAILVAADSQGFAVSVKRMAEIATKMLYSKPWSISPILIRLSWALTSSSKNFDIKKLSAKFQSSGPINFVSIFAGDNLRIGFFLERFRLFFLGEVLRLGWNFQRNCCLALSRSC